MPSSEPIIYILNGPNLNMLGMREPDIYGTTTLDEIKAKCIETGQESFAHIDFRQSNHEGELVDWIQKIATTHDTNIKGVIINAAAYTHTSVAIHDALKLLNIPIVEVHLSNPKEREHFRHHSYIEPCAQHVIAGQGMDGYLRAIKYLMS